MENHQDLEIIRGDDIYYNLTFTDEGGLAIDITDWIVFFTVKENYGDSDDEAIIKVNVTSHTDSVNGKTQIHLGHTETDQVYGEYRYDIQIKKASTISGQDDVKTVLKGQFRVCPDVTRRIS